MLSEHKPVPEAQSKVHDLARRYSAMAKKSATGDGILGLPHDNRARSGSFGRTEGTKVSSILDKYKETTAANVASKTSATTEKSVEDQVMEGEMEGKNGQNYSVDANVTKHEHDDINAVDVEQAIESSLQVAELTEKVNEIDLVDIPLNNIGGNAGVNEEEVVEEEEKEEGDSGENLQGEEQQKS